ncbi:Maf family protein [Aporhodopirellula aestuarii]|uniref:dTTP/UTP pyrophosphatase n=1 Tax=Aporhodopirellula aestuarii TaxID=2950107 RepID=A0ABT0UD18_9BACT|nr:nucleoside triphosphate pyrophosphatase [Aporhodopirellula aestuarii]MCM2374793.1 Maf family protein [Aporhodopirellula aestuarii]
MSKPLPLMNGLPRTKIPTGEPLVLASGSPRRAELLKAAGYEFEVCPAADSAECGVDYKETVTEMVARLAFQKAVDVVRRRKRSFILAADTLAACGGKILGKPADRDDAESMLRLLSGQKHDVFTGVCVWSTGTNQCYFDVVQSRLEMSPLSDEAIGEYLDSGKWEGKAGGFGYQDGNDWIQIVENDSESNVVGLPMERLAEILENFSSLADKVQKEVR